VRNKAGELSKRHFRRVVQALRDLAQTGECELLIIGGHDYEIPEFIQFLPGDMRDRVAGTFGADPDSVSSAGVRRCAGEMLARYQREQEQAMVSGVLEKAAAGQPTALGLEKCLWASCVAAIERLLVEEGATVPGRGLRRVRLAGPDRGHLPDLRAPDAPHSGRDRRDGRDRDRRERPDQARRGRCRAQRVHRGGGAAVPAAAAARRWSVRDRRPG
jgi:hypothetical protein